jgi:hypothetical protein
VMTIKSTVKSIWKPAYLQPLYDLVNIAHVLVTHTCCLLQVHLFTGVGNKRRF